MRRLHDPRILAYGALSAYVLIVALSIWHHEPWADEAHAWLLARDASVIELWTRLMHYEGSPGLWHTLLRVLIKLGMPYRGEDVTSGLLGFAAAWIVLRRAPFPAGVKVFVPFTYFLCYQYVVVARSYSMLPVLLFSCAVLYHRSEQRIVLFTVLLSLMAAVSVHGFLLSGSIWSASQLRLVSKWKQFDISARKRLILAAAGYLLALIMVAWASWPAKDVTFPAHAAVSFSKFTHSADMLLSEGIGGNAFVSLVLIALSIPFLYAGGGLLVFLIALAALTGFGGIVYSQVWHSGTLFLAWLFAMWTASANVKLPRAALAAFALIIAIQCYWTIRTVTYDWTEPYSGSKEAALYIRKNGIDNRTIQAIGYSCSAIQAYFPHNIFSNWPKGKAYWEWSIRNTANQPSPLFSANAPEYVVLGYKARSDMDWLNDILLQTGYRQVKHFDGHLFWHTSIFEDESFDLYHRTPRPLVATLSYLDMADPAAAKQLLAGFYPVEANAWRWSARSFTAVLKPPAGANTAGARFELHLYLSPDEVAKLGPMTLSGDINGYPLTPQTYSSTGTYTYQRDVPAQAVTGTALVANLSFDKAVPPAGSDGRELGAVISSLGLRPRP